MQISIVYRVLQLASTSRFPAGNTRVENGLLQVEWNAKKTPFIYLFILQTPDMTNGWLRSTAVERRS